jgi:transposase
MPELSQLSREQAAALIACARKLLIFANTVVQRRTPWTEKSTAGVNGCYGAG